MGEDSPKAQMLGGKAAFITIALRNNAIHLARKLRVFTVRRDDLAR